MPKQIEPLDETELTLTTFCNLMERILDNEVAKKKLHQELINSVFANCEKFIDADRLPHFKERKKKLFYKLTHGV